MAGAVVFSSLADDGSMLAAIRHVERDDALPHETHGRATWDDITRARDAAILRLPDQEAHFATRRQLYVLSEASSGDMDRLAAVQEAAESVGKDADNLVARLAYAVLLDMQAVEQSSDSVAPRQRAQAIREIIAGPPRAAGATFYNVAFLQMWINVLDGFFERPDVAASLAPELWHYEIRRHHKTLPLVCGHLLDLRAKLRESGAAEDAEACTRWLVECLGGLMLSETDAGTRLLCADLIARTVPADSKVARDMQALRRAYHDAARRAPIDLCDQAFSPGPSVAPTEYRRALSLLVACLGAAAVAVGAAVSLLVVLLIAPIVWRLAPDGVYRLPRVRSLWGRPSLAVVPAGVCVAAIAIQVERYGFYSQSWAILVGMAAVAVGVLTTILLASCGARRVGGSAVVSVLNELSRRPSPTPGSEGTPGAAGRGGEPGPSIRFTGVIGRVVPWAVLAMFVALPLLPPAFVTRVYRGLDLAVGGLWVVIPVGIGLILLAEWFAPAQWGAFAATAVPVACLHVCLALGLCFWHSAADDVYQRAAVEGHRDEVAARLGPDWKAVYLDELLRTYDVPG